MPISLQYPIEFGAEGISNFDDSDFRDAIQQNLKFLLLTIKGEYPMNADFGVGLVSFLFDFQNSLDFGIDSIRSEIDRQVSQFMPYIRIDEIDFTPDNENLYIKIKYTILQTNEVQFFQTFITSVT